MPIGTLWGAFTKMSLLINALDSVIGKPLRQVGNPNLKDFIKRLVLVEWLRWNVRPSVHATPTLSILVRFD